MKKQYNGFDVIGYILLAFFVCFMATLIVGQNFEQEIFAYMIMVQTAMAFIIGAIYLFGGGRTAENNNPANSSELNKQDDDSKE